VPVLPVGTVTFAFTDIEGSTVLLKQLGDGFGDVLAAHRRLVRDVFTAHEGVEIDTQGDAFFFAFTRARDAVAASAEVQRAHVTYTWPHECEVRMRVGLHTGEPTLSEEGYLGLDVVRAARLCGICQGGQVLLSETTRALVGSTLPAGVSVYPLGERSLKDIDEPERVYELEIDGVDLPAAAETQPAVANGGASKPPSDSEQRTRHQQWEEDFERQAEAMAERAARDIMDDTFGELSRRVHSRGGDRSSSGGVDDIAARADELAQRIQSEIDRAWPDASDTEGE
jgi:class 3 adenylate cyclase